MISVLVTGVGGGVGQSILKSLQNSAYRVIGADGDVLAAGLYAVTKAYQVPYAAAPGYVERLLDICEREKCALLFPGLDAELPVLAREAHRFRERGVVPVVSSPEVVAIADDKLETYRFLSARGFPAPRTLPLSECALPFPLVLKPRRGGARSQGVFVVGDERALSQRLSTLDAANYVAQEHIEGDEYTCGSISFENRCYGAIVMRRVLRDGDTYKAFVQNDPRIEAHVTAVAEALKPFGACNFQLRVRDGVPYIFEINARCSGTTHSRTLAGFNEPLMAADYLTQNKRPAYAIHEITILRYWNELVVENERIAALREEGVVAGDGSAL